jgi:hypothetical protein
MCSRADWARRGMVRVASGEGLQGGPVHVLGTLLHEAARGLAHAHKVSGTSRQGRSQTAATPPSPASSAWTSPTSSRSAGRPPASPPDGSPLRRAAGRAGPRRRCCGAGPSRPPRSDRAAPATPWPAPAPVVGVSGWARSLLGLAPILCGACAQPFEPEDDEPG